MFFIVIEKTITLHIKKERNHNSKLISPNFVDVRKGAVDSLLLTGISLGWSYDFAIRGLLLLFCFMKELDRR